MRVDGGVVYVWPPVGHVAAKLQSALKRLGLSWARSACGSYMTVPGADSNRFLVEAGESLTRQEREDTKILVSDTADIPPSVADFGRVMSLTAATARARNGWLANVIAEQRLTSLFQPIVSAAAPHRTIGHECLLRGVDEDGALIPAGRLLDAARDGDLLFPLDRLARETAVHRAGQVRAGGSIFINFTPTSIYDPTACLRTTIDAVDRAGIPRSEIVFEVTETDRIDDPGHLAGILSHYRGVGFRVALDDVGAGYSSLDLLARLRPDFLKIDMHLIQGVADDRFKSAIVRRLIEIGTELDIRVIAEGVETEQERDWLTATGVDYLQGYLFGRPAPHPLPV
ncbi:EAL domain-containing protein [Indioceanicola profundi]|uniref:EAL domain-containing protein n=1 Tax=Indioceanicola profundi TaxID=2220096 RepID=UPI000E6AB2ED|nr:EAL domain-containing protein [Indioceanicola profundi]